MNRMKFIALLFVGAVGWAAEDPFKSISITPPKIEVDVQPYYEAFQKLRRSTTERAIHNSTKKVSLKGDEIKNKVIFQIKGSVPRYDQVNLFYQPSVLSLTLNTFARDEITIVSVRLFIASKNGKAKLEKVKIYKLKFPRKWSDAFIQKYRVYRMTNSRKAQLNLKDKLEEAGKILVDQVSGLKVVGEFGEDSLTRFVSFLTEDKQKKRHRIWLRAHAKRESLHFYIEENEN